MTPFRENYLRAAASVAVLLRDPSVAAVWDRSSVLPEFSVRGLAGHFATQVFSVKSALAQELPTEPPIGLLEHYSRAPWIDAGPSAEINIRIRNAGEDTATDGPDDLAERVEATIAELTKKLTAEPVDRVIHFPPGPWTLRLDDFLTTRMVEILVHSDDLAASARIDTPQVPPEIFEPVLDVLTRLATHRHGQSAMLRALTRAERAPGTITAM